VRDFILAVLISCVTLKDSEEEDEDVKVIKVGICAMQKKSQSKPMKEILTRLQVRGVWGRLEGLEDGLGY
jgi:hypothetical protein